MKNLITNYIQEHSLLLLSCYNEWLEPPYYLLGSHTGTYVGENAVTAAAVAADGTAEVAVEIAAVADEMLVVADIVVVALVVVQEYTLSSSFLLIPATGDMCAQYNQNIVAVIQRNKTLCLRSIIYSNIKTVQVKQLSYSPKIFINIGIKILPTFRYSKCTSIYFNKLTKTKPQQSSFKN